MTGAAISPVVAAPSVSVPIDLRPLTTSELIDRGFALYRAHFAGFLLLALLSQSAPLIGQLMVTALKLNPTQRELVETPTAFINKMLILVAISLVTQIIVFCFDVVITFYIADAYLGKIPSVKESLRRFIPRFFASAWTCILNRILIGITSIFPLIAISAIYLYALLFPPIAFLQLLFFGVVALVLLVASVAPVLIVFMRLMVTVPALALEDFSGWTAVKRSTALVRYDPGLGILYWGEMRLSFLLLPLFVIECLILFLTSLPLTIHHLDDLIRHGSTGQITPPSDSVLILSQILTFLAGSLILPLYSIATALFYYDTRTRREGFDIEFLAGQLKGRP
jgi:hypothetical protein